MNASRTRAAAAAGLALCAGVALAAGGSSASRGGEPEDYKFRQPVIGGVGVTSLEDLRGKPTLIDFWGTK